MKIDLKAKIKSKVKVESELLVNLSGSLKPKNQNYNKFDEAKVNIKLLKIFFFLNIILLA